MPRRLASTWTGQPNYTDPDSCSQSHLLDALSRATVRKTFAGILEPDMFVRNLCPQCDRPLNLVYVEIHNERVAIQTLKCFTDGFATQEPVLASAEPVGGWSLVVDPSGIVDHPRS